MSRLQVRRLSYALGAAVTGVDLRQPIDEATAAELRQIWYDNLLLCMPGQDISKSDFVAFAKVFGEPQDYTNSKTPDPENHNVMLLTNQPIAGRPWDGYKEGQTWHSDTSYSVSPYTATLVRAEVVPEIGGDTMFANQYMAYETLSPAMQRLCENLEAVHETPRIASFDIQDPDYVAQHRKRFPPVVHPVVKVHPDSKRKGLFIGQRLRNFVGMSEEESKPLLDFLNQHAVRYEFTYRHRWTPADIIVWDNRCLMHLAPFDYDLRRDVRHMWRTSIVGPVVGRLYEEDQRTEQLAAAVG